MKNKKSSIKETINPSKLPKRGRPKGSNIKKDIVIKSGKKTINIDPKVLKQAEKLFKKAIKTHEEYKLEEKEINDLVEFYKDKKVSKTNKIEEKPKIKKIQPIPSGVLCLGCGDDIPKQRIDACKGTTKCIKCSDVKTKKPIIVNHGTGDNIYQETVIVDDETYRQHLKIEEATRKALGKPSSNNFMDEEIPKPKKPTDLEE